MDELDCISSTTKLLWPSYCSCEERGQGERGDGLLDDTHSIPDRYRVQKFRIGIQVFRIEVGVSGIDYVHTCGVVHGVPIKDISGVWCMVCGVWCSLCSVWLCGALVCARVSNGNQKRNRRNILETLIGAT